MRIALALLYWSTSAVLAVPVLHTALDAVEQIHVSFAVPDASDESAQTMLVNSYFAINATNLCRRSTIL
jgi:hypothetical protein